MQELASALKGAQGQLAVHVHTVSSTAGALDWLSTDDVHCALWDGALPHIKLVVPPTDAKGKTPSIHRYVGLCHVAGWMKFVLDHVPNLGEVQVHARPVQRAFPCPRHALRMPSAAARHRWLTGVSIESTVAWCAYWFSEAACLCRSAVCFQKRAACMKSIALSVDSFL